MIVMTYNIRSGRNMAGDLNIAHAAQTISDLAPDIVGLNEVRSHSADVGPVNQAELLGELLSMHWRFGKSIPFMGGAYGNAFLSRYPILEDEVVHIPDPPRELCDHYVEHRSVLRAVVAAPFGPLTVLCSHFGLCKAEREAAVATVLPLVEAARGPVVLMGDFNAQPDEDCIARLREKLTDCFDGAMIPHTFPANSPEIKIDYIMGAGGVRFAFPRAVPSLNSDHLPLLSRLEA